MDEDPSAGVHLTNLVTYPPKILPIPMKPLFLDFAWNYIDYPSRAKQTLLNVPDSPDVIAPPKEEKKEVRKGWFGFGR
jgi:signal recognition particle subunit SRP68